MACKEMFSDEELGILIIEVEIKTSVALTWAWSLSLLLAYVHSQKRSQGGNRGNCPPHLESNTKFSG